MAVDEGGRRGRRNRSVTPAADDAPVGGVATGGRRPLFFAPPPVVATRRVGRRGHPRGVRDHRIARPAVRGRPDRGHGGVDPRHRHRRRPGGEPAPPRPADRGDQRLHRGDHRRARCCCAGTCPSSVLDVLLLGAGVVLAVSGASGGPLYTLLPALYVSLGMAVFVIRAARQLAAPPRAHRHRVRLRAGRGARSASAPVTRWVALMAGRPHLGAVRPLDGGTGHRPRHRRARGTARGRALDPRARGAERAEDGLPRPHVARAAHAPQRRGRVRRRAARRVGRAARRAPAELRGGHRRLRARPAPARGRAARRDQGRDRAPSSSR